MVVPPPEHYRDKPSDMAAIHPLVPLEEIAEVRLGKMLDKSKHTSGTKLPYLRNVNVRWGRVDTDDVSEMFFHEDELERYGLVDGDVLVCEGGEPGRASVWHGDQPEMKYQKALHRVRFKVPYVPSLLVYQLELLASTGGLERSFTGSTIKHFTGEAFKQLLVPLPPLEVQQRIVEEIETQLSRLEAGVSALKRAQTNLKRYRAAVLKAACEGRLVPTEAELARTEGRDYETGTQLLGRILRERRDVYIGVSDQKGKPRARYDEPTQARDFEGELPEGWVWATAEQLSDERRAITYGVIKLGERREGGVPTLRSSDVRHLRLDLNEVKPISPSIAADYQRTLLKGDEVLVTVRGTLGGVTVVPSECAGYNISREVAMIAMVDPAVSKMVAVLISSAPVQRWLMNRAKGIAYTGINIETLKSLPLPLPPAAEQDRIVAEVERRLSVVEELEATITANLRRANRLRQSVLQSAFSFGGEIDSKTDN